MYKEVTYAKLRIMRSNTKMYKEKEDNTQREGRKKPHSWQEIIVHETRNQRQIPHIIMLQQPAQIPLAPHTPPARLHALRLTNAQLPMSRYVLSKCLPQE
jgi:hypothetical protein